MNSSIFADLCHDFSLEEWRKEKELLKECVWFDAAILRHPDDSKMYFGPQFTSIPALFEMNKSDLLEVFPTGVVRSFLGRTLKIARLCVKPNALIIQITPHLAKALPPYFETLRQEATLKESLIASSSGNVVGRSQQKDRTIDRDLPPRPQPPSGGGGGDSGGGGGGGDSGGGGGGGGDPPRRPIMVNVRG